MIALYNVGNPTTEPSSRCEWTDCQVATNLECKNRRLHNPSDGKITGLVEIDLRRKHICIGARNDISMNAAPEFQGTPIELTSPTQP